MSYKDINVGIVGLGVSIPEKILSNFDLEKMVDTTDEWIVTRTGISERHIADDQTSSADLGFEAAKQALENANIKSEEIDLIIVATSTPNMFFPSTACIIQDKLGAINAAAFDLSAACSGFGYAVNTGIQFIKNGEYKNVLVIGTETLSKITDWEDRNTCVLFGDGAGAVILSTVEEGFGVIASSMGADGSLAGLLSVPAVFLSEEEKAKRRPEKQDAIYMNGKEVFKFAVKIIEQAVLEVLEKCSLKISDVKMIIPHQANIRIVNSSAERLNISSEVFYTNLHKYGNTSAASIPLAMYEAYNEGKLQKGDLVILVAFGGGATWSATALRWNL